MSLDVSLHSPLTEASNHCETCTCHVHPCLFDANITHNLARMAEEAGIYEAVWRPEEIGIKTARELIALLEKGLETMKADPDRFRILNAPNGWGLYENFVPWLEKYLEACREYPDSEISVSR